MPACITHNLFARDVLARLRESVDECACFWGAQGPDFLFCHRYFQSALRHLERHAGLSLSPQ